MRALDTNVLLRFIMNDDAAQFDTAARILSGPSFLSIGVLIEAGWVLQSVYRLSRDRVAGAVTAVLAIGTVRTPDDAGIRWAIGRYRDHHADWADVLHIVAAKGTARFVSFEKHLAKRAGPDSPLPIERLA